MRFTLAYFVLAIMMVLLTPVVHSLPSRTETLPEDLNSAVPFEKIRACKNACYKSISKKLERPSLFDDLKERKCVYKDRHRPRNDTYPYFQPILDFDRSVMDILNFGEKCRQGCSGDQPYRNRQFESWDACYSSKLNEVNAYVDPCWDVVNAVKNKPEPNAVQTGELLEDTCFAIWLPRFQRGNMYCTNLFQRQQPTG